MGILSQSGVLALLGVLVLLVAKQRVSILHPANPIAFVIFLFSLLIDGFLWCKEWISTRVKMISARIRGTKFKTYSSIPLRKQQFKVTC